MVFVCFSYEAGPFVQRRAQVEGGRWLNHPPRWEDLVYTTIIPAVSYQYF